MDTIIFIRDRRENDAAFLLLTVVKRHFNFICVGWCRFLWTGLIAKPGVLWRIIVRTYFFTVIVDES